MRARAERALRSDVAMLVAGVSAVAVVTLIEGQWLRVTNQTTIALSLLLVVLVVATASARRVAVAISLTAFVCFNFFFLPPVGTFSIADPENWIALFTLLAVSLVASHLSSQVRTRTREATSAELRAALLASLSHDLKTPLTAVTVAANNLNAAWLTEEQRREQAAIVRTELERLNRLFQDIVDMARIDTNAVAVDREWVEPAEIIEAARRQAGASLGDRRVDVDAGSERALVHVDPRITSAALAHVLENAGQYSPPDSPIDIRVATTATCVQLTVRDRGRGIAREDMPNLFERFYRGTWAREHRSGTGMGLAITQGLIAAQRGRIVAANHPEGGAVFTIEVPAQMKPTAAFERDVL